MKLNSYCFTTAGGREENQDSAAWREEKGRAIYVVADGLGGHQNGKLASASVSEAIVKAWETEKPENAEEWLRDRIKRANEMLLKLQEEKKSVMKTTVVVLLLEGARAAWANTGDSRLYHLSGSKLAHVTEDHSVAYKKYKSGEITKAQINTDEDQSCLLKAIGGPERWEPDILSCDIQPGDGFLLCTDGMWEYLFDNEILVDWLKSENSKEWTELLLLRAIRRIEPDNDNLTVMTVMTELQPQKREETVS